MGFFSPKVIYRDLNANRRNSFLRYVGHRVLKNNKNFLCAITGATGIGKSYSGLAICEIYSEMFNIPFDVNIHCITSLKELLELITSKDLNKKIRVGSCLLFDEVQEEGNVRNWHSQTNKALNSLVSTFRNQRLTIFFTLPNLNFLDKQARQLFHCEIHATGYDKVKKISHLKPRFLEYSPKYDKFYYKRLIIKYKAKGKSVLNSTLLNIWNIPIASEKTIQAYELKKKKFSEDLNRRLLKQITDREKAEERKSKVDEMQDIKRLYEKYGEDYLKIQEEMPGISVFLINKYIQFIKKSYKTRESLENPIKTIKNEKKA